MARRKKVNPWQVLPRERKFVKAHVRVTSRGIQFVEPHMREYPVNPFKDMPKPKKSGRKKTDEEKILDALTQEKRKVMDTMNCYMR